MRIYVAGKAEEWMKVRDIQNWLIGDGHRITYDWTKGVERSGPLGGDDAFRRICAEEDVRGVEEADGTVVLANTDNLYGTMVEVGIAVAERIPILLLGSIPRDSIFFYLDFVTKQPAGGSMNLAIRGWLDDLR